MLSCSAHATAQIFLRLLNPAQPHVFFFRKAFEFVRQHGIDAVRVLRLPRNRGKGAAVKAGSLCARGRRVLFMDAGGSCSHL